MLSMLNIHCICLHQARSQEFSLGRQGPQYILNTIYFLELKFILTDVH